ncbi:MAG TPA: DUF1501 domain-containing protein [Candidatus Saccharimonadales bacterium]|nr:DUF1501 domain-containing protein [Candidatus Saccharimonadales bacterium]
MKLVTRRQFIELGLIAGGTLAAGGAIVAQTLGRSTGSNGGSNDSAGPTTGGVGQTAGTPRPSVGPWASRSPIQPTASLADRRLVVIDMAGGNDGLSMVPPIGDSRYQQWRPRTALDAATILPITASVGLHPGLVKLHARGAAIVQAVGVPQPDLSHFEMLRRWWAGDLDSVNESLTGFLGRLADQIGDPTAAAVGVSLGYGPTPALISDKVVTVSMDPYGDGKFPAPAQLDAATAWTAGWKSMAEYAPTEPVPFCSARNGAAYALRFSQVAGGFPPPGSGYPTSELGAQLMLAARIVSQDNGVRIVHVPFLGDFDTHQNHLERHAVLMAELDDGLDAFLADLDRRGIAGRVLVATTSEFGRRLPDNASNGLDHGAASFAMFFGPAVAGLYGTYPSLTALDRSENLIATLSMSQYYATIAESWFGVPAPDVLRGSPQPIGGIIA